MESSLLMCSGEHSQVLCPIDATIMMPAIYSVNVLQSVHLVHFALPHLNASRGIIVPVSSGAGR